MLTISNWCFHLVKFISCRSTNTTLDRQTTLSVSLSGHIDVRIFVIVVIWWTIPVWLCYFDELILFPAIHQKFVVEGSSLVTVSKTHVVNISTWNVYVNDDVGTSYRWSWLWFWRFQATGPNVNQQQLTNWNNTVWPGRVLARGWCNRHLFTSFASC